MARRLEPTVFLAMVSPVTVALVAGLATAVILTGGSLGLALGVGAAVWLARVVIAGRVAKRVQSLPKRIDPFALREPWRFFVSDALRARSSFERALGAAEPGPTRDRLEDLGEQIDRGIEQTWVAAQRGQSLTDARRGIDQPRITRELQQLPRDDPRRSSLEAQLASHRRIAEREQHTQAALEHLEVRLEEAVARSIELGSRAGGPAALDLLEETINSVVTDLEALRLGLDEVEGGS